MATYPITTDTGNGPAEWEKIGRGFGPDAVLDGLGVSVVSGLTVRISTGYARVGGWIYYNPVNVDITTAVNLVGGQNRTDSLFLRRAFNETTGDVSVFPVILSAVGGIPTPVQAPFPGVANRGWEMRLARWSVVGPVAQVQYLVNDGPGDGTVGWTVAGWPALAGGSGFGVSDLYGKGNASVSKGPQPVSVDGTDFYAIHDGIYEFEADVLMADGATLDQAWIWVEYSTAAGVPGSYSTFNKLSRAHVHTKKFLPAGGRIRFRIFQNSGITRNCDVHLQVTRDTTWNS